ncbi:MAG: DUF6799 domain-containing protein [Lutibacter sp.]|uniref:DUF6799 domain-containing protein n=1 Tax=Lutibacter sp. TaxID=1925666 RepID=UPI00299D29B2|nr:DUF6799 domain-containing protein [Lutibacter sp.]MDX1828097.1 DUF6799 domain-containing protein [Lutibacter sp.]
MKQIILFLAFIVLGTMGLVAQDQDQIQDRDQTRLMLVDGDLLQIRDRDQIRLKDKITLNDGTVVNPDGTYQTRDRIQLRLKDGSCLDNDGILYRNEYQYRYKVQQENKGLSEAQTQARNQNRFQIMNIDGQLYQIRNQVQKQVREQLNLGNGLVVNPDGTYQRDRIQLRLMDGECLNMDGEMYKNTYMHRKMVNQKKMKALKKMPKKNIQKKIQIKKGK